MILGRGYVKCPEIRISGRWRTGGERRRKRMMMKRSPGWGGVPGAARSAGWGTVRVRKQTKH